MSAGHVTGKHRWGDDVVTEVRHDGTHFGSIGLQHDVYVHGGCRDAELERARHPSEQAPRRPPLVGIPKPPTRPACKTHECRCGRSWGSSTPLLRSVNLFYRTHRCMECGGESLKICALVRRAEIRQSRR